MVYLAAYLNADPSSTGSSANLPERSKGFDSSSNIFVCAGSNPAVGIFYILFFVITWLLRGRFI